MTQAPGSAGHANAPADSPADPHDATHADPHAGDATTGPHGSMDDHGADHVHDDHGHADEAVDKIDVPAWGAGLLGVILGVVVVLALAIASGVIH